MGRSRLNQLLIVFFIAVLILQPSYQFQSGLPCLPQILRSKKFRVSIGSESTSLPPVVNADSDTTHPKRSRNRKGSTNTLLDDPKEYTIGNYVQREDGKIRILQCYLNTLASIKGSEYAIGIPIDTPAMILRLMNATEGQSPFPPKHSILAEVDGVIVYEVTEKLVGSENFTNLLDHINNQLSEEVDQERLQGSIGFYDNSLQLHNTPMLLTIQGNIVVNEDAASDVDPDAATQKRGYDHDLQFDPKLKNKGEKCSVEDELVDEEYDADSEDELDVTRPDYVSDDDIAAFQEAHKLASSIMEVVQDTTLIGSFYYKKANYHLVKIDEPIAILGRRLPDINGHYYELLSPEELDLVRPQFAALLKSSSSEKKPRRSSSKKRDTNTSSQC